MLDNLDTISQIDSGNGLAIVAGQPAQLRYEFNIDAGALAGDIQSIVLSGMGGSALAGEFMQSWQGSELSLPYMVNRDSQLPGFVNEKTLAIISSYSGNTAETLASLAQAEERKAQIVIMTSGGKLLEIAEEKKYLLLQVPEGLQPRMAVLYGVRALASLFESLELAEGLLDELTAASTWAEGQMSSWLREVPTAENPAKQLAEKLLGRIGIFYAGPTLGFAAHKWKIDLNENAKQLAFYNALPEFDHNEFQGWLNPTKPLVTVVELRSNLDAVEINQRFDISNRLLSGHMPVPIAVQADGDTALQQLVWAVLLGGFVSVYLAVLNGVNPQPVELVEKLKQELRNAV